MAVDPMFKCVSRDLVPMYCQGLQSCVVYTAPSIVVESIHHCSDRCLPHLPLHMHTEEINSIFLTSNIIIGLCLLKALTLTRLRWYEMFQVVLIIRFIQCVCLRGILNITLLRNAFRYRLVRGIPLKEGVR